MIDELRRAAAAGADVLHRAVTAGEIPGAAFGVAHAAHGVLHLDVAGLADPAAGVPVSAETPFSLASTTKPIATTVLGALVQRGIVDLDAAVTSLVPELPSPLVPGPPVTVRMLASHTAGLGTHHRFFYADEREPVAVAEAVRSLARPALPVGGQWRYSNLGYGVLQLVMERSTGRSMAELVAEHVYAPLSMSTAGWGEPTGPAGAAIRHLTPDEPYAGYVTDHPPASEAWCSITDLLRFGLAHTSRSLLAASTHDLLARPHAPRQPDGAAYALGWVTREHEGLTLLVHGGRMGGVGAHLVVVPEVGVVVAALANIETDRLAEAVTEVLSVALPGYRPPAPAPAWSVGRPHPQLARRWTGSARIGDDDLPVVLDAAADRVTVSVGAVAGEVAMPHLQPDGVLGHLLATVPHPLVPPGSICHLDAVVGVAGEPDAVVGALVFAQYPSPDRRRQGDAVSAAMVLRPA